MGGKESFIMTTQELENLIELNHSYKSNIANKPNNTNKSNNANKFKKKYRNHIRLKNYDYCQNGDYFITLSCHQRRPLFGNINKDKMELNQFGKIAQYCWRGLVTRFDFIALDEYIFMPNHFHGIIRIQYSERGKSSSEGSSHRRHVRTQAHSINAIVRAYKSETTSRIRHCIHQQSDNGSDNGCNFKIWQPNYYEHIIGDEKSHYFIREYIKQNPAKWSEDIMYCGEGG